VKAAQVVVVIAVLCGTSFVAGLQVARLGPTAPQAAAGMPPAQDTFTPAAPFLVEDAAGDAEDLGATTLGYGGQCLVACEPMVPRAASPDAGGFDILGVGLAEDRADSFVITMKLADLRQGFPNLKDTAANRQVGEYFACWRPSPDNAERCVLAEVAPHHGMVNVEGVFLIGGADKCNELGWCSWGVPVEVQYGAPGQLRFTVPKDYAAFDEAPLAISEMQATTGWWSTNKAIPLWHFAVTAHVNGEHQHQHMVLLEPADIADVLAPSGSPVTLAPATAAYPVYDDLPLLVSSPGAISGSGSIRDYPELDFLAFDFRQEGEDVIASFQFAGFDKMPSWDLQIAAQFMVKGGKMFDEVGIMQSNGDAFGYAGRCISNGCHDGYLNRVPLNIIPGAPGIVEVRVPRTTWPDVHDGDVTDWLGVYTMFGEANPDFLTPGDPIYGNFHSGSLVDGSSGGYPYVFGSDHAGVFAAPEHMH